MERVALLDENKRVKERQAQLATSGSQKSSQSGPKEDHEDSVVEINLSISQIQRSKTLISMYWAICWLSMFFQLFSSFLPLLYFMLAFSSLGQIMQVKLIA